MRATSLLIAAAALAAVATAPATAEVQKVPAGTYVLDPAHASVIWKVSHLGLSDYTARFTKFDATLDVDPAKFADAKLSVTIDPTSLETDYPFPDKKDFDKTLITDKDWMNAPEHPSITFTSTKVEVTGAQTAKVTGDLNFRGVTKPVTLDVKLNGALENHPFAKTAAMGFSASGTIDRTQFGMDKYAPAVVGSEVKLLIEAEMLKK